MFEFEKVPEIDVVNIKKSAMVDAHNSTMPMSSAPPHAITSVSSSLLKHRDRQLALAQKELHQIQEQADLSVSSLSPEGIRHLLLSRMPKFSKLVIQNKISLIKSKKNQLSQRNSDLIKFKRFNEIPLLPIRGGGSKTGLYLLLAFLFVLEATMNAVAFKEIGGLLTAYSLSVSQALINILTSYIVGAKIAGGVYTKKWPVKSFYLIVSLSHLLLIVWLNLALGLYRAISTVDPMAAIMEPDMLRVAMAPFSHMDQFEMTSVLVSVVGIVLALFAYLKGFYSDDPFPGYGDRYRLALNARDSLMKSVERSQEEMLSVEKEFDLAAAAVHARGRESIHTWSESINSLEKIFVDYKHRLKVLSGIFDNVQNMYSFSFKAVHFEGGDQSAVEIPRVPLFNEDDFNMAKVFSDADQYFLDDTDRQNRRSELLVEFDEASNKVLGEIKEEINRTRGMLDTEAFCGDLEMGIGGRG